MIECSITETWTDPFGNAINASRPARYPIKLKMHVSKRIGLSVCLRQPSVYSVRGGVFGFQRICVCVYVDLHDCVCACLSVSVSLCYLCMYFVSVCASELCVSVSLVPYSVLRV